MSLVQIRMKENTLAQIDNVQNRVHALSRSEAVRKAIELTDVITKALTQGDKIIIEGHNGKRMQVLIPGMS